MSKWPLVSPEQPASAGSEVSVVVTCFNQAQFIGEAIASAQRQGPREVVVIDDGSTDNTATVVAGFPQVRYLRQGNQGVVAARNRGLRESTGRYIVFLDGDDVLLDGALDAGARLLDGAPGLGFVYGRCQMIDVNGAPVPHVSPAIDSPDLYDALLRRNDVWMPGQVMHRRAAVDQVGGFDASVDHSSDLDLYLRLARDFGGASHSRIVAHWRQHGTNTSRRHVLMLRSTLRAVQRQRAYVAQHPIYRQAYESGLDSYRAFYGRRVLDEVREHVRARRQWGRAAAGTLALAWYAPRVLAHYAKARLSHLLGAAAS
jgi:glycosyltransferase involved in cell wall biosynthesis